MQFIISSKTLIMIAVVVSIAPPSQRPASFLERQYSSLACFFQIYLPVLSFHPTSSVAWRIGEEQTGPFPPCPLPHIFCPGLSLGCQEMWSPVTPCGEKAYSLSLCRLTRMSQLVLNSVKESAQPSRGSPRSCVSPTWLNSSSFFQLKLSWLENLFYVQNQPLQLTFSAV